jgi:pimeloyl-ACP methyl ester carboxylesterase
VRGLRFVGRTAGVVAMLVTVACAPPIRANRVDPQRAYRVMLANELNVGELSRYTRNLVFDHDLTEQLAKDPAGALKALHASFAAGNQLHEDLAAAAELNFHYARHGGGKPYYLASALYAWAYLFPADPALRPDRFSPRLRLACDLYNRAITEVMKDGPNVDLRAGTFSLPFGSVEVAFDPKTLRWSEHELTDLVPIAEIEVKGLPTYHRWPGIGAPLAAGIKTVEGQKADDLLGRRIRVPVTALLRFENVDDTIASKRVRATLEIYPGYGSRKITISDQEVPLESEPTAALALTLATTKVWDTELWGFLRGALLEDRTNLVAVTPYHPGAIPVVFVHGTASSAGRWAELYNELDNDPRLHGRFQFWFFSYETGNPIAYSAMRLRESLEHAITLLDPEGRDPALGHMVIIGHSQGGLLTKAMVVESGSDFWRNVSTKSIDDIRVSEPTRDLLRRAMFFHPLPFVERVIFLSTPQRGSYVAGSWIAHQVARLVRAPLDVTKVLTDVVTGDREALVVRAGNGVPGIPSAVDNMTPGNPWVKTMAAKPIAAGVHAHSIIAITTGVIAPGAGDGVVKYDSAHIDGVESELVVKSAHSCQSNPHTIAEVRRILLAHLAQNPELNQMEKQGEIGPRPLARDGGRRDRRRRVRQSPSPRAGVGGTLDR